MQINWLEYKHKPSGLTIKKTAFSKVNVFTSEDPEDSLLVLETIQSLRLFALGIDQGQFCDAICRSNFSAGHQEFLWFAKNTGNEGTLYTSEGQCKSIIPVVDEEELYDEASKMLMRRGFKEITVDGYDTHLPLINDEKSMLYLFKNHPVAQQVTKGFGHIYSYTLADDTCDAVLAEIETLPHGIVVLLYGEELTTALSLHSVVDKRPDIQFFATNCQAPVLTKVIKKGNMYSCKTISAE